MIKKRYAPVIPQEKDKKGKGNKKIDPASISHSQLFNYHIQM
jgi:hypothetical protein